MTTLKKFKQRMEEKLEDRIERLDEVKPKLVESIWMIKVDGKFITVASGKSSWKRESHAKLALKNHFHYAFNIGRYSNDYEEFKSIDWKKKEEARNKVYSNFLLNRVQFVDIMANDY